MGGTLEVPYQQSFEGFVKGVKLFNRHLRNEFLLSDGFSLNEKYGLQPLLLVNIRATKNEVIDFGKFYTNHTAGLEARIENTTGLPPLCDRRYVFDCVGVPDSIVLPIVSDNRYLLKYSRYISQFTHPNIMQWQIGDRLVIGRESCANQTKVVSTFSVLNSLPSDSFHYLAGIGTGHHKVCGFVDSLGEYVLLGTVYIEMLHSVQVSLVDILYDTMTPTAITFDVKDHSTINVGDKLYLSKSCEELDAQTDPALAWNYISFEKTAAASFAVSHSFDLTDSSKNIFKSLELCLKPLYSSSNFK